MSDDFKVKSAARREGITDIWPVRAREETESEPLVRMSLDSIPDQSELMPPPQSQSSMNEANSSKRKRKCEKICTNQSLENSTDATSMYGNSQGSVDISNENGVLRNAG